MVPKTIMNRSRGKQIGLSTFVFYFRFLGESGLAAATQDNRS